jgi:hypothetical protein
VREPRCLEAASVGVILRPRISLRPIAGIFGLGVGLFGGWSSGRGEVAGRDGGSSSVFLAGAPGLGFSLAWVVPLRRAGGLAAGLAGWGLGFLFQQGLRPPHLLPSIPGQGGGPWCWPRRTYLWVDECSRVVDLGVSVGGAGRRG